jgi:mannose-6-phosphate isomerase-like protein (cupin superfamily)
VGGGSVGAVAHTFATFDELGDNYGFRKVRERLGVTAFGVNVLAYPPGAVGVHHYHDEQDELYFVHSGTARFEVDGEVRELGPGDLCHVEAKTPRLVTNPGDADLVLLVVGAKGGYVGRDGQLVDVERDLPRRQAMSRGEFSPAKDD